MNEFIFKIKNSATIVALCLAGLMFASCSDFLNQDNPNKIVASNYFQTENDVLRAVNGAYRAIRSNYCLGEGSTAYTEARSDNMGTQDNQSSAGEPFQFGDFSLLPTNTYLKRHWSDMFTVVSHCNFVLTYIDDVPFADENLRKAYKAETKFLRALMYFHLVRKWGDVPLVTAAFSSPEEVTQRTFREAKEKVYEQIVADLTEALDAGNLPEIQPAAGKGRTCRAAINALLGQVYLTMATASADNRNARLESAKKHLLDSYAARTFAELKEIPYADVFDVDKKHSCPEILFQIVYMQGDRNYSSSVARNNQPRDSRINSQYNSTGGATFVTLDVVKEYETDDLRGDWSVQYSGYMNGYFISKFRDTSDAAGTLGYGGNDWILIRYADVILMLAEVCMLLGDNDAAVNYLNMVRERARLPKYEDMQSDADYRSKYPTLKSAILHERRVELAFENHRWYDLLRFYSPTELESFFHAKLQSDFGIANMSNFGKKDVYYPVPFDEWKLNPEGMYQNEGY
jgi:hypothetical protein